MTAPAPHEPGAAATLARAMFRTWAEVREEILGTLPPGERTVYWREWHRLRAIAARQGNPGIRRARVLYRRKRRRW